MDRHDKIKIYEHIRSEAESLQKLLEKGDLDAHDAKHKELIEFCRAVGMITEDFDESEKNKALKIEFVKAQLIYDDLQMYTTYSRQVNSNEDALCSSMQAVKNILLPLAILSSNIKSWGQYYQDDDELKGLKLRIIEGLDFANHMRNKITGHLEDEVLKNTIQWEPGIFEVSMKDTAMQRFLIYKALIESAANSYIDSVSHKHRIFEEEVDLIDPATSKKFREYMVTLVNDSMEFLRKFTSLLNSKLEYFAGNPENLYKEAGETDFRLKKKGR